MPRSSPTFTPARLPSSTETSSLTSRHLNQTSLLLAAAVLTHLVIAMFLALPAGCSTPHCTSSPDPHLSTLFFLFPASCCQRPSRVLVSEQSSGCRPPAPTPRSRYDTGLVWEARGRGRHGTFQAASQLQCLRGPLLTPRPPGPLSPR